MLGHPWVLGELALGHLGKSRHDILRDLSLLPQAPVVESDELLVLVDARKLRGSGIGWVDAQLIGSTMALGAKLWTVDGPLARVAGKLGLAARLPPS